MLGLRNAGTERGHTRWIGKNLELYTGGIDHGFKMRLDTNNYNDEGWQFVIALFFFQAFFHLDFKSRVDEHYEGYEYGFYYHDKAFVLCLGRKHKYIYMPWNFEWFKTETEHKGNKIFVERKGDRLNWDTRREIEKDIQYYEYPYTYVLKDGTVQNVTARVHVKTMFWCWRWCMWLTWPRKSRKYIDIDFSGEVGERAGSWKGGTVGCSYNMNPGETPEQTLRRMEKERRFDR